MFFEIVSNDLRSGVYPLGESPPGNVLDRMYP